MFQFDKWTLVATAARVGVIYLLDARNLGGENHMAPLIHGTLICVARFGNDALLFGYNGVWGSLSTWVDAQGERWLMVPMMGPPAKDTEATFGTTEGKIVNGSVMAFKVKKKDGKPVLEPVWMSGDLDSPGMPVMANGLVWSSLQATARATLIVPHDPQGSAGGSAAGARESSEARWSRVPSAMPLGSPRKTNPADRRRGGGTRAGAMLLMRFFTRSMLKPAKKSIH